MRPLSVLVLIAAGLQCIAPVSQAATAPTAATHRPSTLARPATRFQQAAAVAAGVKSRFQVSVPREDAELLVEKVQSAGEGYTRQLETPPLEPGKTYEYELTVKWRPNNYTLLIRTKSVRFRAGEEVKVDLAKEDPSDRVEVRFVPTPDNVVSLMIDVAQIKTGDVVFEPGCGDARITIAAVRAGATRGVGIDLDPARISEARTSVGVAKLEKQIEIRQGDALDIKDLSEASVVFLYMGDEFDMLIRPILWKQLKVGTRVVSHRFTMGDWKPDKTVSIDDEMGIYEVHLWTVTQEVKDRAAKM